MIKIQVSCVIIALLNNIPLGHEVSRKFETSLLLFTLQLPDSTDFRYQILPQNT